MMFRSKLKYAPGDETRAVRIVIGGVVLTLLILAVLLIVGCGTCRVVERYNESYASGWIERCPEGVWVYNYDKISDKHQRYLITNYELIGSP